MASLSGVAVDLGGTKLAAARFINDTLVERLQVPTPRDGGLEAKLECLTELVTALKLTAVDAFGVAVAGRVDGQGNWHSVNHKTLTGVTSVPLKDMLLDRVGCPAVIMNDAQAAALGEARFGAGKGADPCGFITVSTGVGGGFVFGGNMLEAPSGLPGHIGFTRNSYASRFCGSGRFGTLESVASGTAIARIAKDLGRDIDSAVDVFRAWNAGEGWAKTIVETSACAVAEACCDLRALLGLERIVIGGSVGLASGYLDQVATAIAGEPELFQVEVSHAILGHDAGLYGALSHAKRES
ncbi:ROK family protein [Pseudovibrio exalbescens]|uniref:N-acetylmannosamine kinase n=1 Tax=Pseudovibrio exalbescens TaxID=197461 RepID=A0A1U7JGM4_9HYPH|nr:ROK family protein [Pseudovibrio exalbescens]OKL43848.1 hypothetical protein A3843_11990 [Pseudovibrio exalbescens]